MSECEGSHQRATPLRGGMARGDLCLEGQREEPPMLVPGARTQRGPIFDSPEAGKAENMRIPQQIRRFVSERKENVVPTKEINIPE